MPQPVVALIAEASHAGVVIVAEDDTLTVSGPARAVALGRALVARKAEVLAHLVPPSAWDATTAVRLLEAADATVERHGCRGAHPDIQAAAVRACLAYRRWGAAELARACAEVVGLAGRLAGATPGAERGQMDSAESRVR